MAYIPKPPPRIKNRITKGNDAFSQQRLECWFTDAFIKNPSCVQRRTEDGAPASVEIETSDGYTAWIHRNANGRYTGVNVQVAHIKDKSTNPELRWDVKNVAPLTPANNQAMKYNLAIRETMQCLMRAWVIKNVRPL